MYVSDYTAHFLAKEPNFWVEWSLGYEKEILFCFVFLNFHFYAFYRHFFIFFPYITLVNFLFQATGHIFSSRNVIFGLRELCTIRNWRILKFFENLINGSFRFWQFFNIILVILEISMPCDLSFWVNFFQQLRWKQVHFISGPPWSKGGNFSKFSIDFYRTYEREVVDIDITMACDISI